jgi:NAD(P)-dependent dehydrogenase (short-subunit alcohol dehydrogenase family)
MSSGARSVVVTGGFGALGRAVGSAFRAEGARVALIDSAAEAPVELRSEFPSPHSLHPGIDLREFDAAERCLQDVVRLAGGIDVLVNVAGAFRWETVADGELATWDFLYAVNLRTAVAASKAAIPHLRARADARIVNIGAGAAAARAGAGMGAYTASKAGVQRLTESLAAELRDEGITVNAILPGTIDTARNRLDMPDADFSRWVAPEAIAEVVTFLASPRARAVTGAAIAVNGRG